MEGVRHHPDPGPPPRIDERDSLSHRRQEPADSAALGFEHQPDARPRRCGVEAVERLHDCRAALALDVIGAADPADAHKSPEVSGEVDCCFDAHDGFLAALWAFDVGQRQTVLGGDRPGGQRHELQSGCGQRAAELINIKGRGVAHVSLHASVTQLREQWGSHLEGRAVTHGAEPGAVGRADGVRQAPRDLGRVGRWRGSGHRGHSGAHDATLGAALAACPVARSGHTP